MISDLHPVVRHRLVGRGVLAPPNPHPGPGQRYDWTLDDERDLSLYQALASLIRDADGGRRGVPHLIDRVVIRWRDAGRPDGFAGVCGGRETLWPDVPAVLRDISAGCPVLVVPAPGPEAPRSTP